MRGEHENPVSIPINAGQYSIDENSGNPACSRLFLSTTSRMGVSSWPPGLAQHLSRRIRVSFRNMRYTPFGFSDSVSRVQGDGDLGPNNAIHCMYVTIFPAVTCRQHSLWVSATGRFGTEGGAEPRRCGTDKGRDGNTLGPLY